MEISQPTLPKFERLTSRLVGRGLAKSHGNQAGVESEEYQFQRGIHVLHDRLPGLCGANPESDVPKRLHQQGHRYLTDRKFIGGGFVILILICVGLFMCSHCKHSGPWNQLELLLSSSNKKKKKVEDDTANLMAEKDKLDEFIKQIRQDTEEIKSLIGNDGQLTKILKKFSLPVLVFLSTLIHTR